MRVPVSDKDGYYVASPMREIELLPESYRRIARIVVISRNIMFNQLGTPHSLLVMQEYNKYRERIEWLFDDIICDNRLLQEDTKHELKEYRG